LYQGKQTYQLIIKLTLSWFICQSRIWSYTLIEKLEIGGTMEDFGAWDPHMGSYCQNQLSCRILLLD